jgi:hypothetical protein
MNKYIKENLKKLREKKTTDDLDLYLLCVKHWGTAWCGVSANWKEIEDKEEEE